MTEKICTTNIITKNNTADIERKKFRHRIISTHIVSSIHRHPSKTELEKAEQDAFIGLNALNPVDALQEMLVAQMLSIHQLQQQAIAFANKYTQIENIQYYTNAAIKLANCFTQQANTLGKLQGHMGHKITVEHVDVHHGGQAIVGNVNGCIPTNREKK